MGAEAGELTDAEIRHLLKEHCYGSKTDIKLKCLNLPVCPVCNIHCNFCKKGFGKRKDLILKPTEAVEVLDRALKLFPGIISVSIVGPGDTLATQHAFETFELINEKYPELEKHLTTNGLMLKENAERIARISIKTVTVNVNAVDADILQDIYSKIIYNGYPIKDKDAALWLLLAQAAGIKRLSDLGVNVNISTVFIPGINDDNIGEVARVTSKLGASTISIYPVFDF
ncbi:MAG: radical SAM protein, partial [Bacillota bacterium]|nr:radical SAM protein [Bacillota bacterium]